MAQHANIPNTLGDAYLHSREQPPPDDQRILHEAQNSVAKWLSTLPSHLSEMDSVDSLPQPTIAHYHGWLDNLSWHATRYLLELDEMESGYRHIGLNYHGIPEQTRRAANLMVQRRLREVFESDLPREQQVFFTSWYRVLEVIKSAIAAVQKSEGVQNGNTLHRMHKDVEAALVRCAGSLKEIKRMLISLEGIVAEVTSLPSYRVPSSIASDEQVDLRYKWSSEGTVFRRWIWTFPEVQNAPGQGSMGRTEEIAGMMLEKAIAKWEVWR
ncbi:hypothetical protein BDV96DRAFT_600882 [Lophiotrema nucula]|uniref:Uncharacterized protein n=1 Tax=Lophiotrema nucula TaxID=690887 RepID=A0A6A5Z3V9_9PLEO|nr:hypothetical protein BDV96DRAFT_600882 [Lophiotrema nucula]